MVRYQDLQGAAASLHIAVAVNQAEKKLQDNDVTFIDDALTPGESYSAKWVPESSPPDVGEWATELHPMPPIPAQQPMPVTPIDEASVPQWTSPLTPCLSPQPQNSTM